MPKAELARLKGGLTPLMMAAHAGHAKSAESLLRAGATKDARDIGDATPLDLAASKLVLRALTDMEEAIEVARSSSARSAERPALIRADIRGVCGTVFCDFGPEHTVVDTDGEQPHSAIVSSIFLGAVLTTSCTFRGSSSRSSRWMGWRTSASTASACPR